MNTNTWNSALSEIISRLEHIQVSQGKLDEIYSQVCSTVFNELDSYVQYRDAKPSTGKKLRLSKPFWCDELTSLWKTYHTTENEFLAFKGPRRVRNEVFHAYKTAQHMFDKRKRQIEREYNKTKLLEIHSVCTDNPKEFWKCIKNLGPSKKKDIPMQVYVDGNVATDKTSVLNQWKSDYEGLYNRPTELLQEFDSPFYEEAMAQKAVMEGEMYSPDNTNAMLN